MDYTVVGVNVGLALDEELKISTNQMSPYVDQALSEKNESVKIKRRLLQMKLSDEKYPINASGENEQQCLDQEQSPNTLGTRLENKNLMNIFEGN